MKIVKFFQYIYLVFVVLFLYDAVNSWAEDRNRAYMSLFFAALAVFMFLFKKRFNKNLGNKNNSK
ncbi:hypothetical protein [Oceanihabitans sediminis]|uniref:Uncharacterized protein n=1 Tax=Oceanihabitans sediminis TaxID=1812012 RepID=A0A368P789_9FLAO|nr:hypothetical protein [Oceanihabitans sediminis]MDX1278194.1 hypothetical protein [Oceanihabitans sediminis]MDX1773937.1 hypothetical protein [Oceanihabitans sediminis]RBP32037.1 hypothetical protein DFR65_10373 [Oceanihabitans sediminis]RCU58692.1 hypothetical protein DU428_04790 [Oceanihabitans sediminis]